MFMQEAKTTDFSVKDAQLCSLKWARRNVHKISQTGYFFCWLTWRAWYSSIVDDVIAETPIFQQSPVISDDVMTCAILARWGRFTGKPGLVLISEKIGLSDISKIFPTLRSISLRSQFNDCLLVRTIEILQHFASSCLKGHSLRCNPATRKWGFPRKTGANTCG